MMSQCRTLSMHNSDLPVTHWEATTLNVLGKSEEYLESVLAESPSLMNLESRRTGIQGPFCIYRQLALPTPTGRTIYPDIVLLTASGHTVIVEVKLSVNQELRNRAVIAQIVDYAASFSALSDEELLTLFGTESAAETWEGLIVSLFPNESRPLELASVSRDRILSGALNLVIACDTLPPGMIEVVRGITEQSALGFAMDLVEVVPYVQADGDISNILFVPSTRLATEIVARTAVTVTYRQGDTKPSTTVETTSLEEIEENIQNAGTGRIWTLSETETAFHEAGSSSQLALLEFAKEHSCQGQVLGKTSTKTPSFGFYVPVFSAQGRQSLRRVFASWVEHRAVGIYLKNVSGSVADDIKEELCQRLREIFGDDRDWSKSDINISWSDMEDQMDNFMALLLWLKGATADAQT